MNIYQKASLLFALSIAIVFRGIPYWIGLIIIPLVLLFADKRALAAVSLSIFHPITNEKMDFSIEPKNLDECENQFE